MLAKYHFHSAMYCRIMTDFLLSITNYLVFKKRTFPDLDNYLRQSFHIFLLQKQHTVLGMMPEPKVEMLLEMER